MLHACIGGEGVKEGQKTACALLECPHSTLSVVANLFDLSVPFFVSVSDAVKTLISANVSDGNKPALMYIICCILQQSIGIYKYGLHFNNFLKVPSSKTSLSHDITWAWFAQILNKNCPD